MALSKIQNIAWASIAKVAGIDAANIAKVKGVEVPSSFSGFLDSIPTDCAFAFGIRRLSGSYTGALIRIIRASDSTEMDIGYIGEDLDASAVSSFCSGTTGYIVKAYDQSGNGRDAIGKNYGTNLDSLPIIYESGAVTSLNGQPAIKITHPRHFSWTDTGTDIGDLCLFGASGEDKSVAAYMVGMQGSSPGNPYKIIIEDNDDQSEVLWFYESGGSERIDFIGTGSSAGATFTDDVQKQWLWIFTGSEFGIVENDGTIGDGTNASVQTTTNAGTIWNIGGLGFSSRNMEGYIQEVAIWPDSTDVASENLFAAADAYYSLP